MNALLSIMLVLAGLAATDSVADRIAIVKTVAAYDFDGGADRLWSEVTRPTIVIDSIRFLAPDAARVEGSMNQYGSAIVVRRLPVRVLLRKRSGQWWVTSMEPR